MQFEFSLYKTIDECTDRFKEGDYVIVDYSFSESFHNKRNIKIIEVFEDPDPSDNYKTILLVKYENDDECYLIPAFSTNYIIKNEKKK